jgi:hypothetical protein
MSTMQEQTQTQNKVSEGEVKTKTKEKVLEYIRENVTTIVLQELTNDILNNFNIDKETVIEGVSKFVMLTRHGEEVIDIINVDLYKRALENNLYDYSIEEMQIKNLRIYKNEVTATTYLPNGSPVADITIWYDEEKLLYKNYHKELKEIEYSIEKITNTLMNMKNEKFELEKRLRKCEEERNKEKGEEEKEEEEEEEDQ